jgi:cyclic pyranopterin phosphate synthase
MRAGRRQFGTASAPWRRGTLRRVKLFAFDDIDETLTLLPLAARRALDHAGLKLSRDGWTSLSLEVRRRVVELGSEPVVDTLRVRELVRSAEPAPVELEPLADPSADRVPAELERALGERPLPPGVWSALSALERYALLKASASKSPDRFSRAYAEIIGQSAFSSHVAPGGGARMVRVGDKVVSERRAAAQSRVMMGREAYERLERADAPKGDVLGTARIAGIQAAKRTWELIPLCHPIALTKADVSFELEPATQSVVVRASVECVDRTGVEMEALCAASVAALTIYDMLKAFDRGMQIGPTELISKTGGRSGDFHR